LLAAELLGVSGGDGFLFGSVNFENVIQPSTLDRIFHGRQEIAKPEVAPGTTHEKLQKHQGAKRSNVDSPHSCEIQNNARGLFNEQWNDGV
jgi:hypothetical protein